MTTKFYLEILKGLVLELFYCPLLQLLIGVSTVQISAGALGIIQCISPGILAGYMQGPDCSTTCIIKCRTVILFGISVAKETSGLEASCTALFLQ